MLKGFIVYTSEDAAYDELAGLDDFRNRNLHLEHNGDIDLVRYEKRGNAIHFESENGEALNYVMGFASETEDNVRMKSMEGSV